MHGTLDPEEVSDAGRDRPTHAAPPTAVSRAAGMVAGYAADLALGDPRRGHPVAGFGNLAASAERRWYRPTRTRGAIVSVGLVAIPALMVRVLDDATGHAPAVAAAVTWSSLGGRSLRREARAVAALLEADQLDAARLRLRSLCGRDASSLDETGLAAAVVESLAENTSDAVVGALWWGTVAGPAGTAAYRAANTLDAMFGHRDEHYHRFGWAAARLDDALNWPPARVSAALTCLLAPLVGGSPERTWRTVRRDGSAHPSPNAGQIEAAFAGALGVSLGGPLAYGGAPEVRPVLGRGPRPSVADIERAARLSELLSAAVLLACAAALLLREARR
jgi:adenosylcobinamide-phosphate synthase